MVIKIVNKQYAVCMAGICNKHEKIKSRRLVVMAESTFQARYAVDNLIASFKTMTKQEYQDIILQHELWAETLCPSVQKV